MKFKNGLKGLFVCVLLGSLCSCGIKFPIEKPESLKIRTSGFYKFTIADKSFNLNEYFSLSSILEGFGGKSGDSEEGEPVDSGEDNSGSSPFNIYQYNPGEKLLKSDSQQFLMKMDMQEIPLDFSSYLENTDFTASIQNMDISKDITVPELRQEIKQDAVNLSLDETINAMVKFVGFTAEECSLDINFPDTENGFQSISYSEGKMVISSLKTASSQLGISLDQFDIGIPTNLIPDKKLTGSVELYKNGVKLTDAYFDSNGIAELALNNIDITTSGIVIKFISEPNTPFFAYVTPNSKVKKVVGLSIKEPVSTQANTSFSMGNQSALTACEIGEGTLEVNLLMPEPWTGIDYNYEIGVSGGLNCTITNLNPVANLENVSFNNADVSAKANVFFKFTDSTLIFRDDFGENLIPSVKVALDIKKIKSATVNLGESYNTKIDEKYDLPSEAIGIIKKLVWNPSGVKLKITNTLPEGNDIEIKLNSDFLGFAERTETITANSTNQEIDFLCPQNHETPLGTEEGQFSKVDIAAEVSFPNYDSVNNTLTVFNVEPGASYAVSMVVEPVFDWKSVTIDSTSAAQSGKMDTGVSLSSIFKGMEEKIGSGIADKLEISTLPLYMFCSIPNLPSGFENPRFVGKIEAFIGDEEGNLVAGEEPLYMLGSADEDGYLTNSEIPEIVKNDAGEVITNISNFRPKPDTDLKSLLSSKADGSLWITYNVGFETGSQAGEISFSQTDIEELKATGKTSISLAAMIVLKLDFNVTDTLEMDILSLISNDDEEESNPDLLNRTEPTDLGSMEQLLDLITSIKIEYEPSQMPFIFKGVNSNEDMGIVLDLDGDGTTFSETKIMFKKGGFEVNPSDLLSTYPLSPKMVLNIPAGNLRIPREIALTTKLWLGIKTDGEIELFNKNKSDDDMDNGGNL
ncbi:MAG: hypothetical protein MJ188_02685 [Treponema sp.]|nr:hypothetical protein [Treponema sp.]